MSETAKGPAPSFPSIEPKHGRLRAEGKALICARPARKRMEVVAWPREEHRMGHNHADALVADTLNEVAGRG